MSAKILHVDYLVTNVRFMNWVSHVLAILSFRIHQNWKGNLNINLTISPAIESIESGVINIQCVVLFPLLVWKLMIFVKNLSSNVFLSAISCTAKPTFTDIKYSYMSIDIKSLNFYKNHHPCGWKSYKDNKIFQFSN